MLNFDKLLLNATITDEKGFELPNYAIGIVGQQIIWVGPMQALPKEYKSTEVIDCNHQLVTPGLIDCHTHLVYAGNRANEFKMRLEGVTYADIAKQGGGILSTVSSTREVSEEALLKESLPRILALRKEGVTTVEIKSGYGLDLDTEVKMLRVARHLGELAGVQVKTTFLGAHAIPPEYKNDSKKYINYLCEIVIPYVAQHALADAIDVFCENIGFSISETEQIFKCANSFSIPIKCHAEQLSNIGASSLAAKNGALSCDHVEYLEEKDIIAMAKAKTIAVLLPGAFYFLKEKRKPPIDLLRQYDVGMAIATDSNPGTSPTTSLKLMMNMACQFFHLTIPEVISGVTYQAARALGIENNTGSIAIGKLANLLLWPIKSGAELAYYFSYPLFPKVMIKGDWIKNEELYQ